MSKQTKKISFRVLGCRLNQSEVASLKHEFARVGYDVVENHQAADITIINSCAVTTQAEAKTRAEVTAANKASPQGKIIMTGCYAQEKKGELLNLPNVHVVIGNLEKTRLIEFIENIDDWENKAEVADVNDPRLVQSHDYYTFSRNAVAETDRTRAFVKIQDGCNYFCSYCIIPYLRGRVRSRKSAEVIKEVVTLEQKGYREIVLSGINIGTYQDEKTTLSDLLEKLLQKTDQVRFRLSSIEPNLITGKMIKLVKTNDRLCNYFHIPLQHGAEPVLKRMNRKYNPAEFASVMKRIRKELPDICVGADAIVGFPGETEADFEQMMDFIRKMNFSYLHVFRYSKREGTKAATMKPQVPDIIKKARSATLRKLGEQLKQDYIAKFLNRNLTVLFEQEIKESLWGGNSGNFIYVKVKANKNLNNQLKKVKITRVFKSHAEGVIIE